MVFLDLKKAYDMVWRKAALVKLARMGITGKIWRLMSSIYSKLARSIHPCMSLLNKASSAYELKRGLPQGANESPIIFTLFIDDLIRELKEKMLGIQIQGECIPGLLLADDIVLLAPNAAIMRAALEVARCIKVSSLAVHMTTSLI